MDTFGSVLILKTHSMKAKLKIILLTFVATTIFWCLVVVGFLFWVSSVPGPGDNFVADAHRRGFFSMMGTTNSGSQPMSFVIEELRANTNAPKVVLLERQVPPAGEFWVGIRRVNPETK